MTPLFPLLRGGRLGVGTMGGPRGSVGYSDPARRGNAHSVAEYVRMLTYSQRTATPILAISDGPRGAFSSVAETSGPRPARCFEPLPPLAEEAAQLPPELRCGGGAAFFASSSGAFPQFGPVPIPLQLRQCPADIFEYLSIDGTSINDGFTDGGMCDQASVRHCHMTVKDDEIAFSSLSVERRSGAPQLLSEF